MLSVQFALIICLRKRVPKKSKFKLFLKGGGRPQSLHLTKSLHREEKKMISLTKENVLVSSDSNRRKFWDTIFI